MSGNYQIGEGLPPLPLAEDVDPALLARRYRDLAELPNKDKPSIQYEIGWNILEYAIAKHSPQHADAAFNVFNRLQESPRFTLARYPFADLGATLASEQQLRQRVAGEPLSDTVMTDAYKQFTRFTLEALDDPELPDEGFSIAPLHISVSALMRMRNCNAFPYIGSVREQHGGFGKHTFYLWKQQDTRLVKAAPSTVGGRHRLERSPPHPDVRMIATYALLDSIVAQQPDIHRYFKRGKVANEAVRRRNRVRYVAELLCQDALGETLARPEAALLNEFGVRLLTAVQGNENYRHYTQPSEGGLTTTIDDQISSAGQRHAIRGMGRDA